MATQSPGGFDGERLRALVREQYDRVACDPHGDFHFHRGVQYAVERLGYDSDELESLPDIATARFAGVGNPLALGVLHPGEAVLDHACGAGTDLLLAARRVGAGGRAIGVDMTPSMCEAATRAAREAGLDDIVEIRNGFFEDLPVASGSIDVVISNGVVNLSPDKRRVFSEIHRVLRPGGRLYLADVVVQRELKLEARVQPELWAARIGGALPERELVELSRAVGFEDGAIVARYDAFAATKLSQDLEVQAVGFVARKRTSRGQAPSR